MNPTLPFILTLQPSKGESFSVQRGSLSTLAEPRQSQVLGFMVQDYTHDFHLASSSTEFWVQEHVQCHMPAKGKVACVSPHFICPRCVCRSLLRIQNVSLCTLVGRSLSILVHSFIHH